MQNGSRAGGSFDQAVGLEHRKAWKKQCEEVCFWLFLYFESRPACVKNIQHHLHVTCSIAWAHYLPTVPQVASSDPSFHMAIKISTVLGASRICPDERWSQEMRKVALLMLVCP